jgi:hypothetical protein
MKLFDQGMRDAKEITTKAAEHEAAVSAIDDERDSMAA